MKPYALHFEWQSFLNGFEFNPPVSSPGIVWLYLDHIQGNEQGKPTLIFRVWYHAARGMIAYVGDQQTGPQSVWSIALAKVIRAGQWSVSAGVVLQWQGAWTDEWEEVQP